MIVSAIVLAAGKSIRMGTNKLLFPWQGKTVLRTVVERTLEAGLERVMVVVGHEAAAIRHSLQGLPVEFCENAGYAQGMGRSIAAGVRGLPRPLDATLILLGDMPFVSTELIRAVADASSQDEIVVPRSGGDEGNPVSFGNSFFPDLEGLQEDKGARSIARQNLSAVRYLEWPDPSCFQDIDTPDDLPR